MPAKGYTTEAKIENFLNISITANAADEYILAAEKYIDQITQRNFKADSAASARFFKGNNTDTILIDDCISVTVVQVANDEYGDSLSTVASGGYILLPRNYVLEQIPIKQVYLKSGIWGRSNVANHKITAKWGYSENPPDDIVFVATVLAGGMYAANRSSGSGEIQTEKIGNYSVTYDTSSGQASWSSFERAMDILRQYIKYSI